MATKSPTPTSSGGQQGTPAPPICEECTDPDDPLETCWGCSKLLCTWCYDPMFHECEKE